MGVEKASLNGLDVRNSAYEEQLVLADADPINFAVPAVVDPVDAEAGLLLLID